MKWFNNLRIRYKVILCCILLIMLICSVSAISFRTGVETTKTFDKFYNQEFVPITSLDYIIQNMLQMRINMLVEERALENKNTNEISARMESSRKLAAENLEKWKDYKTRLFSEKGNKLAVEWEEMYLIAEKNRSDFGAALKRNDTAGMKRASDEWVKSYRKSRDKTNELIKSKLGFAEQDMAFQKQSAESNFYINIIVLAVAIIAGFIITLGLSNAVTKPVSKGLAFAKRMAEGDLTGRIDLDQKDELGELASALNTAADDLEKMVGEIISGSENLAQAVQEISSGNENLAQRTTEQASSLEEVASTIEETSSSISQNADNAKTANQLSRNMAVMAEEGGRVVHEAVNAINEINEASRRIEEIITVINEIAFQTNLLALNAAVEAARAGEQGRGFAVVAGEVRNLAQRSGNAAKEIVELIKDTMTKVEKGTTLANSSGESLEGIIKAVKNVGNIISEIDAASAEQKQGASQINIAVSELDSMTQQNAGLVEETASASEEMANQAQELIALVSRFKIRSINSFGAAQSLNRIGDTRKSGSPVFAESIVSEE